MFLYNHNEITKLSNVAFNLFGIDVYWYGVLIVTGAILALSLGLYNAKKMGLNRDKLLDGFIWGLIIGVIGCRLWYVAFEFSEYKDNLLEIFDIRDGGLAIHGGFIFASIFAFFFCKKNNLNIFKMAEVLAPGFLIGQIVGRWGNFFNQEAHGGLVPGFPDLDAQRSWLQNLHIPDFVINQMYIKDMGDTHPEIGYYHPTFFYESLWNLIGLIIILLLRKFVKKYWVGDAVIFYLIWYSVGRFFIEGIRTDSLMIGGLRTAQITSIIMFIIGIALLVLRRVYKVYPISYIECNEDN